MSSSSRDFGAVAALMMLGLVVAPALAEPPPAFDAARREFLAGRGGDSAAVERANHLFEQLAATSGDDPLVLAYWGASYALLGRDAWAPWTKAKQVEKGLAILDKAVALVTPELDRGPLGLETRLVASATYLQVPAMFHHFEAGKACVRAALASPAFAAAPAEVRADVLVQSAAVARQEDRQQDELAALEQAVAAAPDGAVSRRAKERLAEVRR